MLSATVVLQSACSGFLGKSETEIALEFEAFLEGKTSCEVTADCELAYFHACPVGCYAAVNKQFAGDVYSKAYELSDQASQECAYDCPVGNDVLCINKQCAISEDAWLRNEFENSYYAPARACENSAECTQVLVNDCPIADTVSVRKSAVTDVVKAAHDLAEKASDRCTFPYRSTELTPAQCVQNQCQFDREAELAQIPSAATEYGVSETDSASFVEFLRKLDSRVECEFHNDCVTIGAPICPFFCAATVGIDFAEQTLQDLNVLTQEIRSDCEFTCGGGYEPRCFYGRCVGVWPSQD